MLELSFEVISERFLEDACVDKHGTYKVGVNVASRSPVLNISLAVCMCRGGWDAEGSSSVAHTEGELIHGRGLVVARESLLVVITVKLEVILVLSGELGHHVVDVLHATGACTHGLRREVGVAARAIPVLKELRSERDVDVEVLSNASENIARHPKVVTNSNAFNWADLVFPLAWHDLSVGTRNFDTSIEGSLVVGISNSTAEAIGSADRAVVRALRTGVTILGPAKRPGRELSLGANKSVLLLDTEPRLLVCRVENFLGESSEVSVGRNEILA